MKFQMRCPHCNSVMEAEEEWIGQSAQCPVCNTEIVIQKPDPPAPRLTPVSACCRPAGGGNCFPVSFHDHTMHRAFHLYRMRNPLFLLGGFTAGKSTHPH